MTRKRPPIRVINLLSAVQVEAIIDGVTRSAFQVAMLAEEGDGMIASLSSGGSEVFRVDLAERVIHRRRGGDVLERAYTCPKTWFLPTLDSRRFNRLEDAIRQQYAIGGEPAFNRNLITAREVRVLIDAIRAMVFSVNNPNVERPELTLLSYEGREVLRLDHHPGGHPTLAMTNRQGTAEVVYTFEQEEPEWFWAGTNRRLWAEVRDALRQHAGVIHRVRMSEYRALFGERMQQLILGVTRAMEEAEAEDRSLEKVEKASRRTALHPDVARLIQKDLEEGQRAAEEQADDISDDTTDEDEEEDEHPRDPRRR